MGLFLILLLELYLASHYNIHYERNAKRVDQCVTATKKDYTVNGDESMEKWLYVMFLERGKTYNKITKDVITRHVENIRTLDDEGKIELVGAFKGYPGVAGMVIFKTQSFEEAEELCKREPLVALGYATYKLRNLQVANRDNNYLL